MVGPLAQNIAARRRKAAGFVLSELMISTLIFSAISIGLFMSFTALTRNYAATSDFATNHADQMRISDYMALDLRRAISVTAAQNDTSIYIPTYYASDGSVQTPTLDGDGGVNYGAAGSSIKVRYYLQGTSIYRQEGTAAPVVLATGVGDFKFNVTDAGKVVSTQITFNPTFKSNGNVSAAVTLATSFYNTTLLRNSRRDMVSAIY